MKNHKLLICLMAAIPSLSFAQGSLENPVAGSTESGIGAISGWHCTASNITVTIDGASLGKAGSGTGRGDTLGICGRGDTGYSLLFNYNDLTPGSHTISAFADGQLLETRQFNTIQSGGSAFVTGISKTATISDFPSTGRTATLQWSQAKQSFVVTGITPIGGGGNSAADLSSLQGSYSITSNNSVSGSSCASLGATNGAETFPVNVTTNGNTVTIIDGIGADTCTTNLAYVSGNSTSGFNMNGSMFCGSVSANVTVAGLRKINNQLHAAIFTTSFPGCISTASF